MNFNPQDTHIHTENYTRDILKNHHALTELEPQVSTQNMKGSVTALWHL